MLQQKNMIHVMLIDLKITGLQEFYFIFAK